MKITNITASPLKAELLEPFRISLGLITHTTSVLVRVETDEGITGLGEGAPAVFVSGENLEGTVATVRLFAEKLKGVDPCCLEIVHEVMEKTAVHAGAAKCAVDLACYDILGQAAGLPVWKLLGGASPSLETDITISLDTAENMGRKAAARKAEGFHAFKMKCGLEPDDDIERVASVRRAIGDESLLRLDANQAWSPKTALAMLERLAEYHIELVEQPVPAWDIRGLAFVREHSPVPVMSDEACFNAHDAQNLVNAGAVDMLNIKLMKCGGLYEALRINAVCEASGVECMLGCMIEETNVGITAAASLGAALNNITRFDLDAVYSLRKAPVPGGVDYHEKPLLQLSEKPGFGFSAP
jgi:L-alanine-DL-glutamate epimerase-like enolase superfamily enzyme